jgi:hypothetical protein
MHRLPRSLHQWWQKPLTELDGRPVPAELAVLRAELREGETGAWLNSRGTGSGVVDLVRKPDGKYVTVRIELPQFVTDLLCSLYAASGQKRGMPDLVVWNATTQNIRLVEVKCPQWDRPSQYQKEFHGVARANGIEVSMVEWEFEP